MTNTPGPLDIHEAPVPATEPQRGVPHTGSEVEDRPSMENRGRPGDDVLQQVVVRDFRTHESQVGLGVEMKLGHIDDDRRQAPSGPRQVDPPGIVHRLSVSPA